MIYPKFDIHNPPTAKDVEKFIDENKMELDDPLRRKRASATLRYVIASGHQAPQGDGKSETSFSK